VNRLVLLDQAVRLLFHAVLLGSIWLLFVGHNQPGGGFVGGLVAGAAIALRYLVGGIADVRSVTRLKPWTILGSGLLLAVATAAAPLLAGDPVLQAISATVDLPIAGEVYLSSTLAFDAGVYLLVVGLVFMVFEAFGEEDRP
jgi:multicomponent Na+:H+ antiporter subunit A